MLRCPKYPVLTNNRPVSIAALWLNFTSRGGCRAPGCRWILSGHQGVSNFRSCCSVFNGCGVVPPRSYGYLGYPNTALLCSCILQSVSKKDPATPTSATARLQPRALTVMSYPTTHKSSYIHVSTF